MCVAWLPKATVQAAVGGAALDLMQERGYGPEAEERGRLVLMLSVLVILLTAPVGAIGIAILGPLWLTQDEQLPVQKLKDVVPAMAPALADEAALAVAAAPAEETVTATAGAAVADVAK